MQIAVYGGSFDPPHLGHAMVACWALWSGRVEGVWFVPTWSHAFSKQLAPFSLRAEMCQRLCEALHPALRVSTIEQDLPSPSYTIETLRALQERHPEHQFRLLVGGDTLQQTHLWRDWEGIERAFSPLVVGRAGYPEIPDAPTFPPLSSTEVRDRVREGRAYDHLIHTALRPLVARAYARPGTESPP